MSTTGTTSGNDFSGMQEMLKQTYTKAFENNVEKESEVADLINTAEGFEIIDGPDGKQINVGHIFSSGGGVGAMLEDDYLPTPTNPTTKQSVITIPQLAAVVELSGRVLRRVRKGPAAFLTWADEALPRKAQRLAFHKDRMYLGTGSGIIGRLSTNPPTGTNDAIGAAFGIAGLEGAERMLLRDDPIRLGPNANGTSLRTGNLVVASVDVPGGKISTTNNGSAGTATSAAVNDYVFLGDAAWQGAGAREMMGFEGIIDNGTNLSSFQGLTRASYPELNAQIIDASAGVFTGALTEEILDYAYSQAYEVGNLGKPTIVFASRSGQRSLWKSMKGDRSINDPRATYRGGRGDLIVQLGGQEVTVRACRKVPTSRCYGIDPSAILRFRIGQGRWDDTDGAVFNRVVNATGRKDAFFAVYIEEEQLGAGDPAKCFKITGLSAA